MHRHVRGGPTQLRVVVALAVVTVAVGVTFGAVVYLRGRGVVSPKEVCSRLLRNMISVREVIGSPEYVSPRLESATAFLDIPKKVRGGRSELPGGGASRETISSTCLYAPHAGAGLLGGADGGEGLPDPGHLRGLCERWGVRGKGRACIGALANTVQSMSPTVDIPSFTLLGTYPGDLYNTAYYQRVVSDDDKRYTFAIFRAAEKFRASNQEVTFHFHLVPSRPANPTEGTLVNAIPYVNEAPVWADYNTLAVTTFGYMLDGTPTAEDPERVAVVEYYTCRDVKAGDELFVYYGAQYTRDYDLSRKIGRCQSNKELVRLGLTASQRNATARQPECNQSLLPSAAVHWVYRAACVSGAAGHEGRAVVRLLPACHPFVPRARGCFRRCQTPAASCSVNQEIAAKTLVDRLSGGIAKAAQATREP